jgi:ammonium transporter, Amt family
LIVSVNFSVRQIINSDLVDNIRSILSASGFDPQKLWLEVTESLLVENSEAVVERLQALRAMGIRIEIDDFGTGYSSLSYLQNLPVDGFKIDRSFVSEIQGEGRQIVKTLVDLGHSLGLTQVAEGVETEDQKEYLKATDCDYIQGFLMSQPVSAQAIAELIKKAHS